MMENAPGDWCLARLPLVDEAPGLALLTQLEPACFHQPFSDKLSGPYDHREHH